MKITMFLKIKTINKLLIGLVFICIFYSCRNNLENVLNEKIAILERIDSSLFVGYQIYSTRPGPSFEVTKIPYNGDYALIRTRPKPLIEKNFPSGDSIDILFVKEFAMLDSRYLYITREYTRIDFYEKNRNFFQLFKKFKVILLKRTPPAGQEFIADNQRLINFNRGWYYLIVEP